MKKLQRSRRRRRRNLPSSKRQTRRYAGKKMERGEGRKERRRQKSEIRTGFQVCEILRFQIDRFDEWALRALPFLHPNWFHKSISYIIRDYLRKDKRQKLRNQIINVFLSSPFLFFSILERERDIYIYIFYINSSIRKREKEKKWKEIRRLKRRKKKRKVWDLKVMITQEFRPNDIDISILQQQ